MLWLRPRRRLPRELMAVGPASLQCPLAWLCHLPTLMTQQMRQVVFTKMTSVNWMRRLPWRLTQAFLPFWHVARP